MKKAPIALFAYNRPEHLYRTLEYLKNNEGARESLLVVFSDAPKSEKDIPLVAAVREKLKSVDGFIKVEIVERDHNMGLAESIDDGISKMCDTYGKVIVLEDDLLTAPHFLSFMNDALDRYQDDERVISVHGYVYPTTLKLPNFFFLKGADCWGWATWARGWKHYRRDGQQLLQELERKNLVREFDFNSSYPYTAMLRDQILGNNKSWAIRWYASAFLANKLTLYPGISLVKNIGLDGSGVHCDLTEMFDVKISGARMNIEDIRVEDSTIARRAFEDFFKKPDLPAKKIWLLKLISWLKRNLSLFMSHIMDSHSKSD